MDTVSLLVVAAEAREVAGILQQCGPSKPVEWPGAAFAREISLRGRRAILIANGPGPRLVNQALASAVSQAGGKWAEVISTGFCGALDPALKIGDIVVPGAGEIWSEDRIAVSAEEKRRLRKETGARVVEMEYSAVAAIAQKWDLPCRAIRAVSDTAQEDLPLDFNLYRDKDGRFQTARIAAAGLLRPFAVMPGLLRLNRNSRIAAEKLGAFFANCEF
jgi:adenosylhomocysteine nucleosidase